jgi:hypothetical protein
MHLTQRENEFALHLAETLDDMKSLLSYQRFVQRYSESFLDEILEIVIKTPKERIRNSRGAYFTFLVTQRAHSQKHYDRS